MKGFVLIFMLSWNLAFGQQHFFTPETKKEALEYYQKKIYDGCSDPKEKQDPVIADEMKKITLESIKIVQENFSRAFSENPKVAIAFKRDLKDLALDQSCQKSGNHCRVKLMGLSIYYYQQLRADIDGCQKYKILPAHHKAHNSQCEVEAKFRGSNLQGVGSGYGAVGIGSYKKELIATKNNTTLQLFNTIINKDRMNLHVCNGVQNGLVHQYALDMDDPGHIYTGLDPDYDPAKNPSKDCKETKIDLMNEFMMTNFDEGRNKVGLDEVEPVKKKVAEFIKMNPTMIVTDVTVTSSSPKVPFYKMVNGKKVIDPASKEQNLSLAKEKAVFVQKALSDIQSSSSDLLKISFTVKAELAGPEFEPIDLNDRFVTRMTPGYLDRVEVMYQKNKKMFEEQALRTSALELMDEKKFVNLYQAKFKAFQGYRILIQGYVKEKMKCLHQVNDESKKFNTATKQ